AIAHERLVAIGLEAVADARRPTVLPDDRVVDGLACPAIPDQRGFALVGDAHGGHIGRPHAAAAQHLGGDRDLRTPDLERIVLDPTGLRKVLRELALRNPDDRSVTVEQDGARTRGALVESKDVGHWYLSEGYEATRLQGYEA